MADWRGVFYEQKTWPSLHNRVQDPHEFLRLGVAAQPVVVASHQPVV